MAATHTSYGIIWAPQWHTHYACVWCTTRGGIRFLARFPLRSRRLSADGYDGGGVRSVVGRVAGVGPQQLFSMSGKRFERRLPPCNWLAIGPRPATGTRQQPADWPRPATAGTRTRTASIPRGAGPPPPRSDRVNKGSVAAAAADDELQNRVRPKNREETRREKEINKTK